MFRQAYAVPAPVLQRLLERPAFSSRVYLWIQRPLSCLRRRLREPVGDVRGILGRLSVSTLSLQCCQRTSNESRQEDLELFWACTLPFRGRLLLSSSGLACYSATVFLSITTNETSLLSGRHSAMVTLSPVAAAIQGGLWARVLLLRLSYRLYFG